MKAPETPEEKAAHEEWKRKSVENNLRSLGRAISGEEKREVVERLLKVWEKFPALRLGQLIENRVKTTGKTNLFFLEDRHLCDAVEEFANKHNK